MVSERVFIFDLLGLNKYISELSMFEFLYKFPILHESWSVECSASELSMIATVLL
jgi:hypothetical protein